MKKFIWTIVALAAFVLVVLLSYSYIIDIGKNLRSHSEYIEYTFYGVVLILFYFFILDPLVTITLAPYYSIAKYCDDSESNNSGIKKRARRLIKHGNLMPEDIAQLKESLNGNSENRKKLSFRMYIVFNNQIKKNIDKIVSDTARDTLYLTALSQKSFGDMMIVLINNFRMIKKIVVMCGFRPSFLRLMKLYANVFFTSLVADGAQKVEVSSLISTSIQGSAKLLTDSAANGMINSFFVLRIGMLTKNYLYCDDVKSKKLSLRNSALAEAARLFPSVIASLLASPIKGVVQLLKPKKIEDVKEEIEDDDEEIKWNWKKDKNKAGEVND